MTLTILNPIFKPEKSGNHTSEDLNFYILKARVCLQTLNLPLLNLGSFPCTGLTNQVQLKTNLHLSTSTFKQ